MKPGNNEKSDTDGMTQDDLIICRCEGVRLGRIKESIHRQGAETVNAVKKLTRAGMGLCRGKTCGGIVEKVLGNEAPGFRKEAFRSRPPVRCVGMAWLAETADAYDHPAGPTRALAPPSSEKEG